MVRTNKNKHQLRVRSVVRKKCASGGKRSLRSKHVVIATRERDSEPPSSNLNFESEQASLLIDIEAASVVLDTPPIQGQPYEPNLVNSSLEIALSPFLQSRAGGEMSASAGNTAVHRIGQFIVWAHRHLHNNQPPSDAMARSAHALLQWFMTAISKHPHVLEDYISYQSNVICRSPSTTLNHLDALVQCYNFLVYDGRIAGVPNSNSTPLVVDSSFTTRFPFFNLRCRRALKKQLKQYK